VEGIPGWFWLALFVAMGLAGVSALLAVVAGGFVLTGRTQQALKPFAGAVLCAAMAATAITLTQPLQLHDSWPLILVFALSLLLAGAGQFAASYRSPQTYAVALTCAAASMAFAAGPLTYIGFELLRGPVAAASSLLLAVASLMAAVLSPSPGPLHPGLETPTARPRSRKRIVLILGLVNLVMFIAAFVYLRTDDYTLSGNEVSDAVTNTRWDLVFAVLFTSALLSVGLYAFLLKSRNGAQEAH
jgi:hypothetical protein